MCWASAVWETNKSLDFFFSMILTRNSRCRPTAHRRATSGSCYCHQPLAFVRIASKVLCPPPPPCAHHHPFASVHPHSHTLMEMKPLHSPELRGARKRARALATRARHLAHQNLQNLLSTPPETSQAASHRWNHFYSTKHTLFKDRHVLRAQFPEMMSQSAQGSPHLHVPPLPPCKLPLPRDTHCDLTLVEVGCGVGNGLFPVLRANPRLFAYAFDYSDTAVDLVCASEEYRTDRVQAFHADLSQPETYSPRILADVHNGADFVTALWTLSALPPGEQLQRAVQGLAGLLKSGGLLFVRDYAVGDMRQRKFEKGGRCVQGRLYLRGDGTYAYFFEPEELKRLFEAVGLMSEVCECVEREVTNKKEGIVMARRWIYAKLRKPH